MKRKPIRLSNPTSYNAPVGLRENEAFVWMEKNLLRYKVFGDDKTYLVSGINVTDSDGNIVNVAPTSMLHIKGDFIQSTMVQLEDDGSVSLDIALKFDAATLADMLPSASPATQGLALLQASLDETGMGTDGMAATPWSVKYLELQSYQHTNNIRTIISPVASKTNLPTNPSIGTACLVQDDGITYVYDTYIKSPRVIGTYTPTGFDGSFSSKPISRIALCNINADFLKYGPGNIFKVVIQNISYTLTKTDEPADFEELCVRYDIPSFMKDFISWFTVTSGEPNGLQDGAYVYMKQWEASYIPSVFIQNTSGWKTL